jgi:hypothetical protein
VAYGDALGGLTFDEIGVYSTLAPGQAIPATTTGESTGVAAEVAVSVSVAAILLLSHVAWGLACLRGIFPILLSSQTAIIECL